MPDVIVKLRNDEGFQECCSLLQSRQQKHQSFRKFRTVQLSLDDEQSIEELIDPRLVERVDRDVAISIIQDQRGESSSSTPSETPWGLERIGAKYRSIPQRYSRPKVAIMDTGLTMHPSLSIAPKYANFSNEKTPRDLDGHGTHMAGIIGGFPPSRKSLHSFHGAYPQLPLNSVKVFAKDGTASLSSVMKAIEWCMEQNVQVINMSFGIDEHNQSLHDAIRVAHDEGMIMVAASGNDGNPGLEYPARYPEVISVGAVNQEGQVSSFSQFGTNLDVVAPGENIFSTWPQKKYNTLSGTSTACAHVTGVVALMLAVKPDLSPAETRQIVVENTERLSTSPLLQGNGLVSVTNVIQRLRE